MNGNAIFTGRPPDLFRLVGGTPAVRVELRAPSGRKVELRVKLEGANPTGSVKDRAAVAMIEDLLSRGAIRSDSVLLDASSGNMASAIAVFGRALGVSVTVVCNPTITTGKRRLIEQFGGEVIVSNLGPYTFDGNRRCRQLVEQDRTGRYCFLDQLHNPANPLAHERGTGPEILAQDPMLQLVVGSLGSGGTMLGVTRAIRRANRSIQVAAVSSAAGSRLPGVGAFEDGDYLTPFIRTALDEQLFDFHLRVTNAQAADGHTALLPHGLFCGPQSGAVVAAALRLADRLDLADGITVISGDAGWKSWA